MNKIVISRIKQIYNCWRGRHERVKDESFFYQSGWWIHRSINAETWAAHEPFKCKHCDRTLWEE